jgi:hypothetical protein
MALFAGFTRTISFNAGVPTDALQLMKIFDKIGPYGVGILYTGVPAIFLVVIGVHLDELCRLFGNHGGAYAFVGITMALGIIFLFVRFRISKRTAMIAGTVGWLITFSFAFWWYCFGPGAFGHAKIWS